MMSLRRMLIAATVLVPLVTGCGALRLEQLPAPKGVSGPTYRVTAQFQDVQNLTEGAKIKLQGVEVGVVSAISTRDFHAEVRMDIAKKFPLPATSTFQVRFTTPLGEDFIAVSGKAGPSTAMLADGARIPLKQTSDAPGIEDTFAALSLLLNGGGLDKLQTIAKELDAALKGRTGNVRDGLIQLHTVIANFDANKGDFDRTLDGLKAMTVSLNSGSRIIEDALATFPQTLQLLADDTGRIRQLLGKVATLGDTLSAMLARSQADMLADFDALRPTLDALQRTESNLLPTFNTLISFGKLIDRAAPGDYLNLSATIQFLLSAQPQRPTPGGSVSRVTSSSTTPQDAFTTLLSGGLR